MRGRWDLKQSCLSLSDTLSRSACIITGGSAHAATLADALQKPLGALDMVRVWQLQLINILVMLMTALLIPRSCSFYFPLSSPSSFHLKSPHKLSASSAWVASVVKLTICGQGCLGLLLCNFPSPLLIPPSPDLQLPLPLHASEQMAVIFSAPWEFAWLIECFLMGSYLLLSPVLLPLLHSQTWQAPSFHHSSNPSLSLLIFFWARQIPKMQTSSI